jgi:circadian clock protein KaiC
MTDTPDPIPPLQRVSTGVSGLDRILGGGLLRGGIYIVAGVPGAGKTILGNQIAFHHVGRGARALYVSLLAENHGRMLALLQSMSFFDRAAVGHSLNYLNGFTALEADGLDGLLRLIRQTVRERHAELLVLDGMVTAGSLARSEIDYKKFIISLQTWVGMMGCTVLFLSSMGPEPSIGPEQTMVDGILELRILRPELRAIRQLSVLKLRGSAFVEGGHTYEITSDGLTVFPRLEALPPPETPIVAETRRVSTSVPGLDAMLGGGLAAGSTTLILGPSGSGKTILGLHFLEGGAALGEPGLYFGFFEPPGTILAKARRLGLDLDRHLRDARVTVSWRRPAERNLDALGQEILATVEQLRVQRLVIDGLVGFKKAHFPERLSAFFAALSDELIARGVTTLITEETRELYVQEIEVPLEGVSAIFHNILFLRQIESGTEIRHALMVMKTRDSDHEHALHELTITSRGVVIGRRLGAVGAILGRPHEDPEGPPPARGRAKAAKKKRQAPRR